MNKLRIGTLVSADQAVEVLPQIIPHGFESFSLTFWQKTSNVNLEELAKKVNEILADKDIEISCLSFFGNPLTNTGDNSESRESWQKLIDKAHLFNTDMVTGFTGRIPDKPIDKSIPKYKEVFGDLAKRARDKGVKIAFENCDMGGDWENGEWNIAHNPTAWKMMFDALPAENIGLEWEPCHQMVSLIDPIPQLRKWVDKIFHVHGKDATIAWDIIKEYGIDGPKDFVWHRTPGFGDTDWTDIITILRQNDYDGNIDIEGYHDPVYRDELEMTGQVRGLNYLKKCRGGDFIPNP
ncbi:MAG: sugar phosphate isomerase/epimerase family protein [bacterium]